MEAQVTKIATRETEKSDVVDNTLKLWDYSKVNIDINTIFRLETNF